jgi:hypothetical protein
MERIYRDNGKGLKLSAYSRNVKSMPIFIKIENTTDHKGMMVGLTRTQAIRLALRILKAIKY